MKNLIGNIFWLFCLAACVQAGKTTTPKDLDEPEPPKYDIAIKFGSICCGPASDDFLKKFVSDFCQKNKNSIHAFYKGSCGREGEYIILFSSGNISKQLKASFTSQLESILAQQNIENKSNKTQKGPITLLTESIEENIKGCRGALTKWEYNR